MNFLRKLKNKNKYFKNKILNLYNRYRKLDLSKYPVLKYNVKSDLVSVFNKFKKKMITKFFILKDNFLNPTSEFTRVKINAKAKLTYLKDIVLNKFNNDNEKLFESNSQDNVLLPPSPLWSRWIIWTLGLGSISILLWSVLAKVQETILLSGQLQTETPEIQVSAFDPGTILSIEIKEHQKVSKGDVLLVYTDKINLLRANNISNQLQLHKEKIEIEKKLYAIKIQQKNEIFNTQNKILEDYELLLKSGAVAKIAVEEQRLKVIQVKLESQQILDEQKLSLNNAIQKSFELNNSLNEINTKLNRYKITSPSNGYIQSIKYRTPGERVQSGDILLSIIPDRKLVARVTIPSRLSAPIEVNSEALIDIDAYPASDFGSLNAIVKSISPTTTDLSAGNSMQNSQRIYAAELELGIPEQPDELNVNDLRPGMSITAKLKLREKPVIATVFDFMSNLFTPMYEEK